MIIVRMETEAGTGVYRAVKRWPEAMYPGHPDYHPSPLQDRGLRAWWDSLSYRAASQYHFAFRNPTQAKAWFYSDEHIQAMMNAGVGVGIYLVDDAYTKEGWAQVVFIKEESRRLAWYEDIEAGLEAYDQHTAEQSQEVQGHTVPVASELGNHPHPA